MQYLPIRQLQAIVCNLSLNPKIYNENMQNGRSYHLHEYMQSIIRRKVIFPEKMNNVAHIFESRLLH